MMPSLHYFAIAKLMTTLLQYNYGKMHTHIPIMFESKKSGAAVNYVFHNFVMAHQNQYLL